MTSPSIHKLRLSQVERALQAYFHMRGNQRPRGGWLRAIRESLGRSIRVQAEMVGVAPSTLQKSEKSEAEDRITLAQLRKLAEGLDCELVYALIPKKPLTEMINDRAYRLAKSEVASVSHSMYLEDQMPSNEFIETKVKERHQELINGPWKKLWKRTPAS